jgi:hypothetical protein
MEKNGGGGSIVSRREAYEATKIGLGPFPDGALGRSGASGVQVHERGAAKIRRIIPKGGLQSRDGLLSGGHRRTG